MDDKAADLSKVAPDCQGQEANEPSPAAPLLGNELNTFVRHMEALASSTPLALIMTHVAHQTAEKRYDEILEKHATLTEETESKKIYKVDPSIRHEVHRAKRRFDNAGDACTILPLTFIVSLVSQFDFFLGRLLRCLFYWHPELLNASEKQLTFGQLLQFGSMDAAKEYILEKEIESVLRLSHVDQFVWLENKFKVPLRKDLTIWPTFVELTERRNLFVHTNGVVTTQYLTVCRAHNVNLSGIKAGDVLSAPPEYFSQAHRCMFEIGVKLGQVLWRKLRADDIVEADNSLIEITFDLLVAEKYQLVTIFGDFARKTLKKWSDDQSRRIIIINRAIAYKWMGDDKTCLKIISDEDWTACENKFKLAVAVLKDEFEKAAAVMRKVGKSGEVREEQYSNWPVFREFRKSSYFLEAYAEIFGHPFTNISILQSKETVKEGSGIEEDLTHEKKTL